MRTILHLKDKTDAEKINTIVTTINIVNTPPKYPPKNFWWVLIPFAILDPLFIFTRDSMVGDKLTIDIAVASLLIANAIWISYVLRIMGRYAAFNIIMKKVQAVITDLLHQSLDRGSINLRELCKFHGLRYSTFRNNLVRNMDCDNIFQVGDLNLDEARFYSYMWNGQLRELSGDDAREIIRDFETFGTFNLTKFANKRQADIDAMKILLYRFCGANKIQGRVETAPNGDYMVIPVIQKAGDFILQLDKFIQQVMLSESTQVGKKIGEYKQ